MDECLHFSFLCPCVFPIKEENDQFLPPTPPSRLQDGMYEFETFPSEKFCWENKQGKQSRGEHRDSIVPPLTKPARCLALPLCRGTRQKGLPGPGKEMAWKCFD